MFDDSASHRVFKISELTSLIASHLVLLSKESTVNLACTCWCLEEPVLSTLWEECQFRFEALLEVLPEGTWDSKYIQSSNGWEVRYLELSLETSSTQVRLL